MLVNIMCGMVFPFMDKAPSQALAWALTTVSHSLFVWIKLQTHHPAQSLAVSRFMDKTWQVCCKYSPTEDIVRSLVNIASLLPAAFSKSSWNWETGPVLKPNLRGCLQEFSIVRFLYQSLLSVIDVLRKIPSPQCCLKSLMLDSFQSRPATGTW